MSICRDLLHRMSTSYLSRNQLLSIWWISFSLKSKRSITHHILLIWWWSWVLLVITSCWFQKIFCLFEIRLSFLSEDLYCWSSSLEIFEISSPSTSSSLLILKYKKSKSKMRHSKSPSELNVIDLLQAMNWHWKEVGWCKKMSMSRSSKI